MEAYHAGLMRTTINYRLIRPARGDRGIHANLISALRATLSQADCLEPSPSPYRYESG